MASSGSVSEPVHVSERDGHFKTYVRILLSVSFLKSFTFARRVLSDRAPTRLGSLSWIPTRETSFRPTFAGQSRLMVSSERAKMRRAGHQGGLVRKTAIAAQNGVETLIRNIIMRPGTAGIPLSPSKVETKGEERLARNIMKCGQAILEIPIKEPTLSE